MEFELTLKLLKKNNIYILVKGYFEEKSYEIFINIPSPKKKSYETEMDMKKL